MKKSKTAERDALLAAFENTEQDHAAFRAGDLSKAQRRRISDVTRSGAVVLTQLTVFINALVGAATAIFFVASRPTWGPGVAVGLAIVWAAPVAMIVWAVRVWRERVGTVPKLEVLVGKPAVAQAKASGKGFFELRIGAREFIVNERAFRVLRPNASYRVFYIASQDIVIGMEPADSAI